MEALPFEDSFSVNQSLGEIKKWCFSWGIPKGLEPGRGELEFLFFAFQKIVYSPGTVISPTVKRTIVRI